MREVALSEPAPATAPTYQERAQVRPETVRRLEIGKHAPTIEQAYVHNWAKDPWAFNCERSAFPLGTLAKFWPHIMAPVGRIHFAGSHADNLNWGMDAATRSANRVAQVIDEA